MFWQSGAGNGRDRQPRHLELWSSSTSYQPWRASRLRPRPVISHRRRSSLSRSAAKLFVYQAPRLLRTVSEVLGQWSQPNQPIAPSYFSQFFEDQLQLANTPNIRTLYIDRDPETFREIARHLQGTPRKDSCQPPAADRLQAIMSDQATARSSSSYSRTRNSTLVRFLHPVA